MCYQWLTRSVPEFRKKRSNHIFHSQFSVLSSLGGGSPPTWPSFVQAKTLVGQLWDSLLGQISDVLSTAYAICPRISQKNRTTFSILNSPFRIAAFAFSNRDRKRKERKGDAEFAKAWMRRETVRIPISHEFTNRKPFQSETWDLRFEI